MIGFVIIVSYDFVTGENKDVLLPNGRYFFAGRQSVTVQTSTISC